MKAALSIIIMLTVTPIVSATGLISFDPSNWGGGFSLTNILAMAFFGLISVPLWFTFIPALILTPIFMSKLSHQNEFHNMSLQKLLSLSLFYGALAGIFILSPPIFMLLGDTTMSGAETIKLVANWAWAGALSGSITFTVISIMYRRLK